MLLNKLREGGSAVIAAINCEEKLRQRLNDLGFIKGAQIKLIFFSPFKSLALIKIYSSRIAIKTTIAACIEVNSL